MVVLVDYWRNQNVILEACIFVHGRKKLRGRFIVLIIREPSGFSRKLPRMYFVATDVA